MKKSDAVKRLDADRPYRRCSSARLRTLRAAAVRDGDAATVRLLDDELPRALADEADDSALLSQMTVFAL